jgi:phosphate:Na+ symporter
MELMFKLAGGIGLFLIGMLLLTDGLKTFAGEALRQSLVRFTGTPAKAFASGALVTLMVQSSSATTVAVIGFVSAGLLTFPQAVGVVIGTSLGTTGTGWIVAVLGLKISIGFYALPLVGAGHARSPVRQGPLAGPGPCPGRVRTDFRRHRNPERGHARLVRNVFAGRAPLSRADGQCPADAHRPGHDRPHAVLQRGGRDHADRHAHRRHHLRAGGRHCHRGGHRHNGHRGNGRHRGEHIGQADSPGPRLLQHGHRTDRHRGPAAPALLIGWAQTLGLEPGAVSLAAFHTVFIGLGVALFPAHRGPFCPLDRAHVAREGATLSRHLDDSVLAVPEVALEATRRAVLETARATLRLLDRRLRTLPPDGDMPGDEEIRETLEHAQQFFGRIPAIPEKEGPSGRGSERGPEPSPLSRGHTACHGSPGAAAGLSAPAASRQGNDGRRTPPGNARKRPCPRRPGRVGACRAGARRVDDDNGGEFAPDEGAVQERAPGRLCARQRAANSRPAPRCTCWTPCAGSRASAIMWAGSASISAPTAQTPRPFPRRVPSLCSARERHKCAGGRPLRTPSAT